MDFFDHQDTARQRTGLLVFLFSLAVVTITGLVSVLSIGIYYGVTGEHFDQETALTYVLLCFAGVLLVVTISSMVRVSALTFGTQRFGPAIRSLSRSPSTGA